MFAIQFVVEIGAFAVDEGQRNQYYTLRLRDMWGLSSAGRAQHWQC